ncbi:putative ZDHHC-type palmitoyltransferase 8 [Trichoplax sp. H2]|nr:putative ZDHHC-type palmitoyltransferase 8 [Trichoplax sp. H2]|eukprot:RDD42258.1 putative ZDHHC-type palmitoyltransferase 8 [Trichoplax sp. H2]
MDIIIIIIIAVGILQLPLLVDVIRNLFPRLNIERITQDYASYLLFSLVVTVYSGFMYLFFSAYLYVKAENPYATINGWIHIFLASYFCIVSFFHYTYASFHDPGTAPLATLGSHTDYPVCTKCDRIKVGATRHCKVCQRCICMMDHHCPFTVNCVGLNNFYYFVSFLGYAWLGMSFAIYMTFTAFMGCMIGQTSYRNALPASICFNLGKNAIVLVPIVTLWLALGTLLAFQITCLLCNVSTLDFSLLFRQTKSLRKMWYQFRNMEFLQENSRMQVLYFSRRNYFWQHFLPLPIQDLPCCY